MGLEMNKNIDRTDEGADLHSLEGTGHVIIELFHTGKTFSAISMTALLTAESIHSDITQD